MADKNSLFKELREDEGLELKPYKCTENKWTIGIGRNLEDTGISEAEAYFMFDNDLTRVERELSSDREVGPIYTRQPDLTQNALLNMCFQLGLGGLKQFRRMWAALDAEDYELAYTEALDSRWARQTPNRANRVANQLRGIPRD